MVSAALLIALPLVAGTLPSLCARLGPSRYHGNELARSSADDRRGRFWLSGWLSEISAQHAIAMIVLAAPCGVVYLKWRMFPDMNRIVIRAAALASNQAEPGSSTASAICIGTCCMD